MTDLTHEQAHRFLQPGRQAHMSSAERQALEAHLANCEPCRRYAAESDSLQARLRHALHARWDPFPGPASSYAPSVLAYTRRQTMVRNTFRLTGSLVLGILLIAALAGIINTFRPQPAVQPYGAPFPSQTKESPSLPESTPQISPTRPQPETTQIAAEEPQATLTTAPGIGEPSFTLVAPRQAGNSLIAYTTNQDGNSEIYTMNPDGSSQRNLTNNPANDWAPVWSPDGTRLAFLSDRTGVLEIYAVNADGTGLQQLTHNTFPITNPRDGTEYKNPNEPPYPTWESPSWSPDGKYLTATLWKGPYTSEDFSLARIAANGSGMTYIQNGPYFRPQWSPDGALLAAVCRNGQQEDICILDPIHLQTDGSAVSINITNSPDWNESGPLRWSPDGNSLAYAASLLNDENMSYAVYGAELRKIERNGWKQRTLFTFQLTRSGSITIDDFAWSPDGKRLALIFPPASSPKANHIYLINADGSGLEDLGEVTYDPRDLRWSPDGRFLLFSAGAVVYEQDASGKQVIARDERAIWTQEISRQYFQAHFDGGRELKSLTESLNR